MDLSILIPARCEEFLTNTIDDILKNSEMETEVIAVLDGQLPVKPIPQHERVNVIQLNESIGQRAATNMACRLSKAKYVMKLDAHCAFDKGFDRKMIDKFKEVGDNVTMLPIMRNLWAFDWVCEKCDWRTYQADADGKECPKCKSKVKKDIKWIGKKIPQSTSYCFNSNPQFKYFEDYKHRPKYEKDKKETGLTETMSIQGSCFMLTRKNYWDSNICDEKMGNWGHQGIEVACKTWLTGGRVLVNHTTWYAHLFRTNHNLKFPWPVSGKDQNEVKKRVTEYIYNGKIKNQKYPVSWLVKRFWPVYGWTDKDLKELEQKEVKPKNNS